MIRYVLLKDGAIEVEEILFQFSNCNAKTSDENANMIIELLEIHEIPSEHYIVQGYDIGCNISGKYNGAQAKILEQSHSAVFSPCWLSHAQSVWCWCCWIHSICSNFLWYTLGIYNLFTCSHKRWKILLKLIGSSLYSISGTRWSDRVENIKPFAAHLPGIKSAIEESENEITCER